MGAYEDLMFGWPSADHIGARSSRRRALNPGGALVSVKTTTHERAEDLTSLRDLMARGAIRPVLDRSYPLEEVREAHRYVRPQAGDVLLRMLP